MFCSTCLSYYSCSCLVWLSFTVCLNVFPGNYIGGVGNQRCSTYNCISLLLWQRKPFTKMKCKYIDKLSVLFRIKSCVDLRSIVFYHFSATFIWTFLNSRRCGTSCPNSLLSEVRISLVYLWANGKEVLWFCPHSKQWKRRQRNLGGFLLWYPEFVRSMWCCLWVFVTDTSFYVRGFLLLDICMSYISYPSFDWGWRPLSLGAN